MYINLTPCVCAINANTGETIVVCVCVHFMYEYVHYVYYIYYVCDT